LLGKENPQAKRKKKNKQREAEPVRKPQFLNILKTRCYRS
jgi:hypothetical protein